MALRRRFREWNIQISSGLVAWAHESNYRSVQLLGHLHWQCQEYILGRVGQEDVAVANVEFVCLAIALYLARSPKVAAEIQRHLRSRQPDGTEQPERNERNFRARRFSCLRSARATIRRRLEIHR